MALLIRKDPAEVRTAFVLWRATADIKLPPRSYGATLAGDGEWRRPLRRSYLLPHLDESVEQPSVSGPLQYDPPLPTRAAAEAKRADAALRERLAIYEERFEAWERRYATWAETGPRLPPGSYRGFPARRGGSPTAARLRSPRTR